jgi:hypothetical protein
VGKQAARHIATPVFPFLTSFYGNGGTKFPKTPTSPNGARIGQAPFAPFAPFNNGFDGLFMLSLKMTVQFTRDTPSS